MQCGRIQTSGEGTSARRHDQVVCSCQSRDTVQKDDNVLFVLHKTLRALDKHLGHPLMMLRQLVKSRVDDFHILTADRLLDIRYLFRAFVNQKHKKMHFRIISQNRERYFL